MSPVKIAQRQQFRKMAFNCLRDSCEFILQVLGQQISVWRLNMCSELPHCDKTTQNWHTPGAHDLTNKTMKTQTEFLINNLVRTACHQSPTVIAHSQHQRKLSLVTVGRAYQFALAPDKSAFAKKRRGDLMSREVSLIVCVWGRVPALIGFHFPLSRCIAGGGGSAEPVTLFYRDHRLNATSCV